MNCRLLTALRAGLIGGMLLALLASCGVGSGGTGMPKVAAQGTVNGFGSVIVDGVRYDDSQVPTLREDEPGVETQTASMLGDSLDVESSDAGVATRVRVDATLIGPVASISAPGSFIVLGQPVMVNSDAAHGPVTQFSGGYTGSASVTAGDAVEIHGLIVRQGGSVSIQATRVGRLPALPRHLKATGIVGSLASGAFNIGNLRVDSSTAALVPQGSMLANGAVVSVLAPSTSLTVSAGVPRIVAAQVRVRKIGLPGDQVSISGVIANLDATATRFELGGVSVLYAGATITPAGSSLATGRYVRVTGLVAADGSVHASAVAIRDGVAQPEAELHGNIAGYVAATKAFSVRGVAVDARAATLEGCPAGGLADGLYVEVEGALGATGVVARKVHCDGETAGATIERTGVASSVDPTAATFVLTPATGAPVNVRWTAATYFNGLTPASLAGRRVEVQGTLAGGVLTAQKVEGN